MKTKVYKVPRYNKSNHKLTKQYLNKIRLYKAKELKGMCSQKKLSVEKVICFC